MGLLSDRVYETTLAVERRGIFGGFRRRLFQYEAPVT